MLFSVRFFRISLLACLAILSQFALAGVAHAGSVQGFYQELDYSAALLTDKVDSTDMSGAGSLISKGGIPDFEVQILSMRETYRLMFSEWIYSDEALLTGRTPELASISPWEVVTLTHESNYIYNERGREYSMRTPVPMKMVQ